MFLFWRKRAHQKRRLKRLGLLAFGGDQERYVDELIPAIEAGEHSLALQQILEQLNEANIGVSRAVYDELKDLGQQLLIPADYIDGLSRLSIREQSNVDGHTLG